MGKYGIHTFEKAVVRVSWVVPEIVNRPIVMYEIERATSGLDVYLEGACTIEELHYEKVDSLALHSDSHLSSAWSLYFPILAS